MQKERKQLEELFQKYRQGLITKDEKALLANWLAHLDLTGLHLTDAQLQAKEELSKSSLEAHFFPVQQASRKIRTYGIWFRTAAASLFLALTLAGAFYFKSRNSSPIQLTFSESKTGNGEIKLITLTDGTEITLNNESTLKYPSSFSGNTREVYLSGEAFFKVSHNPKKPFKVHTDKMDIQVLGTSFDIKAYKNDPKMRVAVASGKVGVMPNAKIKKTKTHILLPGDQLTYNHSTAEFSMSKINPIAVNSWQNGKLVFKNETLINISRQLERQYKVKFKFSNKTLESKELNLNIKSQSLNVVMKALSLSGNFHYTITGTIITIW